MKGTPFKTRRISPFMKAEQGLMGEALQEPEITPEQDLMQEPVVAPQMQVATPGDKDEDKYKQRNIKYNATVEEANELYGNGSTEEINTELGEMGSVINTDGTITFGLSGGGWDFGDNTETVSSEKIFDISSDGKILGESVGRLHHLSKGVSKQVFSYGTVERVRQPSKEGGYEDEFVENITITAKNHPLYGNTYTRTGKPNPERKTVKPIEDLNSVLSNYNYDNREATADIFSIRAVDGKPEWHFAADGDFEQALNEGWLTNKDGSSLDSSERNKLMQEFKKASDRFKNNTVTSTKLNKK